MSISKIYTEDGRQFVSFGGACPFSCLHCYTFCNDYKLDSGNTVSEIIETLKYRDFNIAYVSGHKENFIDPDTGLALCEEIFRKYSVDILITTRNVFNDDQLRRIDNLQKNMSRSNKHIYFCVSIPAFDSYKKLEPNPSIPTPSERISFLRKIFHLGINTILTIRPLCPNEFIPVTEALQIITECKSFSSVVLSSGIVVNTQILNRLKNFPINYSFTQGALMKCLENDISMQYVDVSEELKVLADFCSNNNLPFFQHSLPAINYIRSNNRFNSQCG